MPVEPAKSVPEGRTGEILEFPCAYYTIKGSSRIFTGGDDNLPFQSHHVVKVLCHVTLLNLRANWAIVPRGGHPIQKLGHGTWGHQDQKHNRAWDPGRAQGRQSSGAPTHFGSLAQTPDLCLTHPHTSTHEFFHTHVHTHTHTPAIM